MLLHWRANLSDQNKQQQQQEKICVLCTIYDLSVWNKPLIDTCQYCWTSQANQVLRSLANAGFQNRGVCLQAFPSFPSLSSLFHIWALASFLARWKPKVCSVAVVSSVAVWSSHLSTNRMRSYLFQAKCVVIVFSPCDFPTRGRL